MKKVLAIIPDNNKGKFITKGFISAFKSLSFFVYEIKTYDLKLEEINKIVPDIVFIFWTDSINKAAMETFWSKYSQKSVFIHCAEYLSEIPEFFKNLKSHYIFSSDNITKKENKFIPAVSALDYKVSFEGYRYNITFAGNPAYKNREIILAELIKHFSQINIFCRSCDFYKSIDEIKEQKLLDEYEIELYRKSYKGFVKSQKELAQIYVSSKINLDLENTKPKDINYRLLEITASGGFVIAPYSDNLTKQYDDGKDIETYKNLYELIDKTNFYLKNSEISQAIALRGKRNTVSNFSYNDKLKAMLKVIYGKDFSSR